MNIEFKIGLGVIIGLNFWVMHTVFNTRKQRPLSHTIIAMTSSMFFGWIFAIIGLYRAIKELRR